MSQGGKERKKRKIIGYHSTTRPCRRYSIGSAVILDRGHQMTLSLSLLPFLENKLILSEHLTKVQLLYTSTLTVGDLDILTNVKLIKEPLFWHFCYVVLLGIYPNFVSLARPMCTDLNILLP